MALKVKHKKRDTKHCIKVKETIASVATLNTEKDARMTG